MIHCPHCRIEFDVPPDLMDHKVFCPGCGRMIRVAADGTVVIAEEYSAVRNFRGISGDRDWNSYDICYRVLTVVMAILMVLVVFAALGALFDCLFGSLDGMPPEMRKMVRRGRWLMFLGYVSTGVFIGWMHRLMTYLADLRDQNSR